MPMGKGKGRRRAPSGQAAFNRFLNSIPAEADIEIEMVADSTDPAYGDIDTNIHEGEAWAIYGAEYVIESDTVASLFKLDIDVAGSWCLQIQRNDDNTDLIAFLDTELMFAHYFVHAYVVTTSGAAAWNAQMPFRFGKPTFTFSPKLRAVFATYANEPSISAATYNVKGHLFYDRIPAPNIGASKFGQLANM